VVVVEEEALVLLSLSDNNKIVNGMSICCH
jgi:hypothetical protein